MLSGRLAACGESPGCNSDCGDLSGCVVFFLLWGGSGFEMDFGMK